MKTKATKTKPWGRGGDAIFKRGRSWVLDFRHKGQRHKITLGPLPNRSAAREVAQTIRAGVIKEGHGIAARPAPSLTLDRAARLLIEWAKGDGRPKTARWYEGMLRPVLRHLGDKRLSDVSAFTLEKYKRARLEEVAQQRSGRAVTGQRAVNAELSVLRRLYNMMITWNKAAANPVKGVKRFKEGEPRTRWLTGEEIGRLLANCNPRLKPAIVTALHTGLRCGELLSLRAGDVDLVRRTVTVRAAFSKNGESRSVPMNDALTQALRPLIIGKPSEAPVFESRKGEAYRSLRTAFATACRKAGITDFRWHDLRHTYASHLVMAGVDLPTVKELLGHKSFGMTLRYSHLSQDHKRQAVDRLAEKIGVGVPPDFPPQAEKLTQVIAISR